MAGSTLLLMSMVSSAGSAKHLNACAFTCHEVSWCCNYLVYLLKRFYVLAGAEKGLVWETGDTPTTEDGKWVCNDSSQAFISQTTLHPCSLPNHDCCQATTAAVGVRYVSNLWDEAALVEITFEVWPTCGDGLSLHFILTQNNSSSVLFSKVFPALDVSPPHRETFEKVLAIFPGDSLLFLVQPGANHDCDGVYVHDIKIWQSEAKQIFHSTHELISGQ